MKKINTRIYGNIEDIDAGKVCEFWNSRALKTDSVKGVLLGEDFVENSAEIRNSKEKYILKSLLQKNEKFKILDIGSGIGRWVGNLKSEIDVYHGIDFSKNFVCKASELYKNHSNVTFFNMSATDIDQSSLLKLYDLVIINGVCMYINDVQLLCLFDKLNKLTSDEGCIYLQESISTLSKRLTLKDFYSEDLNCRYSAIYRTKNEYEEVIARSIPSFKIISSGLLLDKETGAREETNARYWFLSRRVN